jgi:hypothetical protein
VPDNTEQEISAIFARLKDEVRNRPAEADLHGSAGRDYTPATARLRAERTWSVSAERPFQSPPEAGLLRRVFATPAKRVLRKSMRWYVEPLAAEQRSFNLAILTLVDELAAAVRADVAELESRVQSLEERHDAGRAERPG